MATNVQDLQVYREFYRLALSLEKNTRGYGPDFRWLRQQSLRSSESVCANMAEGVLLSVQHGVFADFVPV